MGVDQGGCGPLPGPTPSLVPTSDCFHSQTQTVLEVLKGRSIPISLWILIGSIIGGLLLLALIVFILWKVLLLTVIRLTLIFTPNSLLTLGISSSLMGV